MSYTIVIRTVWDGMAGGRPGNLAGGLDHRDHPTDFGYIDGTAGPAYNEFLGHHTPPLDTNSPSGVLWAIYQPLTTGVPSGVLLPDIFHGQVATWNDRRGWSVGAPLTHSQVLNHTEIAPPPSLGILHVAGQVDVPVTVPSSWPVGKHFFLYCFVKFNYSGDPFNRFAYLPTSEIYEPYMGGTPFHFRGSAEALDIDTFRLTGQDESDTAVPFWVRLFDEADGQPPTFPVATWYDMLRDPAHPTSGFDTPLAYLIGFFDRYHPTYQIPNPGAPTYNLNMGANRQVVKWIWDFDDGTTSVETQKTVDHTYLDDGGRTVRLKFEDQFGLQSDIVTIPVTAQAQGQIGAISDEQHVVYTATKNSGNTGTLINRFKSGPGSREIIATIANYHNPHLFQNGARGEHGHFYLLVQGFGGGLWNLFDSADKGVTWVNRGVNVGTNPFDGNYRSATATGTIEGIIVVAAINKSTYEVVSRCSFDRGLSWQPNVSVGTLDSTSQKALCIVQESASGGSRLMVTNGSDFFKFSDDLGGTWT